MRPLGFAQGKPTVSDRRPQPPETKWLRKAFHGFRNPARGAFAAAFDYTPFGHAEDEPFDCAQGEQGKLRHK